MVVICYKIYMATNHEIWKDIKGFEGLYQVSNLGRVKSFWAWRGANQRILNPYTDRGGYLWLSFSKNKKSYFQLIHRLVANAFIPNPKNKRTVNHKNGDKTDNRVENLEWCTQSENNFHAYKNGLQTPGKLVKDQLGEKNLQAKLTKKQVLEIRKKHSLGIYTQKEIGEQYGVGISCINAIIKNRSWRHIQ